MTATVDPIYTRFLPVIEDALREHWSSLLDSAPEELRHMIAYHMGWEENTTVRGKRIRPAFILSVVDACGKDWYAAVPAAVSVEWLHNFSLIHDDIQDQSELRHGRETLWKRWGIPQAINTGDTVFTLAFIALTNLGKDYPDGVVSQLVTALAETCLRLTEGQHLDLLYETQAVVSETDYLRMVSGKTAALLGCCMKMGAVLGRMPVKGQMLLEQFGNELGLAFQIQDDCLGLWGSVDKTGKSTGSDLAAGKKTLPILHAMSISETFRSAWQTDHNSPRGIQMLLDQLAQTDSYAYAKSLIQKYTEQARISLQNAFQDDPSAIRIFESLLAHLMDRET
jgi:geranylgeranyl diphosphate synthase, type I